MKNGIRVLAGSSGICPKCGTPRDNNIAICTNCGQKLLLLLDDNVIQQFTTHEGAADLFESALQRFAMRIQLVITAVLLALMIGGLALLIVPGSVKSLQHQFSNSILATIIPTTQPTYGLSTVTPGPATPTPTSTPFPSMTSTATSTPEPCIRQVNSNDTLYALAASCGHSSFDVLQLIVEINELADANSIIQGQTLIIPWPTAVETPTEVESSQSQNPPLGENIQLVGDNATISAFDEEFDPLAVSTPTLMPGIQFHTVVLGETMISIAQLYNVNASLLSQLNPEIEFTGCDFGTRYGGPRCIVNLAEGQKVRVPAPPPTPTLSPTPSGSETPTPSPTATFNAPSLQSPSERTLFRANELITLRWSPTGTLNANEVYRVQVEDITAGAIYLTDTTETFFILPDEWQGTDTQRHEYRWYISVIQRDDPTSPAFITESRTFTWEGRGESR